MTPGDAILKLAKENAARCGLIAYAATLPDRAALLAILATTARRSVAGRWSGTPKWAELADPRPLIRNRPTGSRTAE